MLRFTRKAATISSAEANVPRLTALRAGSVVEAGSRASRIDRDQESRHEQDRQPFTLPRHGRSNLVPRSSRPARCASVGVEAPAFSS